MKKWFVTLEGGAKTPQGQYAIRWGGEILAPSALGALEKAYSKAAKFFPGRAGAEAACITCVPQTQETS